MAADLQELSLKLKAEVDALEKIVLSMVNDWEAFDSIRSWDAENVVDMWNHMKDTTDIDEQIRAMYWLLEMANKSTYCYKESVRAQIKCALNLLFGIRAKMPRKGWIKYKDRRNLFDRSYQIEQEHKERAEHVDTLAPVQGSSRGEDGHFRA